MSTKRPAEPVDPRRIRRIAAVHACKKRLDLDEETYRGIIERVTAGTGRAVRSAADCSMDQLALVLKEFERLGATRPMPKRAGRRPTNFLTLPEYITKIEAQLTDMKLSWAYADAIAKRMFGVARVSWCTKPDELRRILSALAYEQRKRALIAECERYADQLRIDLDSYVAARAPQWGVAWKRRIPALKTIAQHLLELHEQYTASKEAQPA